MFASFIVASAALCAAHSVHGSEVFDHQTEWAIELVNTFNVPVRIVHRESGTAQDLQYNFCSFERMQFMKIQSYFPFFFFFKKKK